MIFFFFWLRLRILRLFYVNLFLCPIITLALGGKNFTSTLVRHRWDALFWMEVAPINATGLISLSLTSSRCFFYLGACICYDKKKTAIQSKHIELPLQSGFPQPLEFLHDVSTCFDTLFFMLDNETLEIIDALWG